MTQLTNEHEYYLREVNRESEQFETALLKTGMLQKAIVNSANFSSIATDEKGVIQLFNVGAERMLGYKAIEVVDKITLADISDPEEVNARAKTLSLELGTSIKPGIEALVFKASRAIEDVYELTYIRKDGSRFPAVVSITALHDDFGGIIGYLLIGTDNTARKQAEEALIKAAALQNAIFNSANFSCIATDEKGVIQLFNVGAERMLGYKAIEVVDKITPANLHDPQEMIARATMLSSEFSTPISPGFEALVFKASRGLEDIYELTKVRKDGSRFPAVVSVTALRDTQDQIIGYLLIGTDNTARKQAEEALRNQAVILDRANDTIFIRDSEDRIVYWNQGAQRLYGWNKEEALGQVSHTFLKMQFSQSIDDVRAQLLAQGYWKGESRHTRRDGSLVTVASNWTLQRDDSKRLASVLEINYDITARKSAEEQLEKNRQDIVESAIQLQAANKELEEFAYVASHDLKAPLRVIDNASKWLEEDLQQYLTDETREHMNLLRGRVRRMDKLLDDLLEYALIGRATDGCHPGTIKGTLLMEDVLALLAPTGFLLRISPNFAAIQVCRMPLQQILTNLLDNAIKHHDKKKGCIDVTVDDEGDHYAFAVKDDGPGIPAHFHDQIFKMFQTLRPRDQVEGSGMGLAMVRKNVEVFSGTLRLESAEGQGSTFRFTWPKQQQLRRASA